MEQRYIVFDWGDDLYTTAYETLDEANQQAQRAWERLTRSERGKRHIYVGLVTEELLRECAESSMCEDDLILDDGSLNWSLAADCDGVDGAFDSDYLAEEV